MVSITRKAGSASHVITPCYWIQYATRAAYWREVTTLSVHNKRYLLMERRRHCSRFAVGLFVVIWYRLAGADTVIIMVWRHLLLILLRGVTRHHIVCRYFTVQRCHTPDVDGRYIIEHTINITTPVIREHCYWWVGDILLPSRADEDELRFTRSMVTSYSGAIGEYGMHCYYGYGFAMA